MTDFKKLKVAELRAELAARNLPQTGKRDELIERLEEYEFHHAEPSKDELMDATEYKSAADSADFADSSEAVEVVYQTLTPDVPVNPSISPILPPSPITINSQPTPEEIEEEKRRQRAIRFGLDPAAPVKIEVTIKRLEHALPNHHRRRHHHRYHKSSDRQVKINKP